MAKQVTTEEVDAFVRNLKWLIFGVALFQVAMIAYVIRVDRQLDSFKDLMRPSLPQELEGDEVSRGDLYHLAANPVEGQVVYVPAYSHIYHGGGKPYLLAITLGSVDIHRMSLISAASQTNPAKFSVFFS